MATEKPKKKSSVDTLREEIQELSHAIQDLHEDVRLLTPAHPAKRALMLFLQGALKGLGFIFGTTIIAALIVFLFQKALKTEQAQEWIDEKITNFIEQSTGKALERIDPREFIR